MPRTSNDKNVVDMTGRLIDILSSQTGIYSVQSGSFYRTDIFALCDAYKIPSCFGNNSESPYFSCAMEKAPGQLVPNMVEAEPGKCLSFRMGFNEAIVLAGKTPPPTKYFSYCAFLTTQSAVSSGEDVRRFKVTPIRNEPTLSPRWAQSRDVVFSCLGEPVNNLKISTPGTPGGAPGCPYGQPFLIVFTGSEELQKSIFSAAQQAGFSSDSLNSSAIPEDIVNFGVTTQETDTFSVVSRISGENVESPEMAEYLLDPGVSVFRVTANMIKGPALPIPFMTPRGTGKSELEFLKAVEELRGKIIERYSGEYEAVDIPTDIWLQESMTALQQNVNNLGETRDCAYFGSGAFTLPEDAFIVAYGANHAKTGKSTCCSAAVYGKKFGNGVVSTDDSKFEGSAFEYLPSDEADYLYAWKFGFNQNQSEHYSQIPAFENEEKANSDRNTRAVNPKEDIYLAFRAYLEPGTKVGPSWNELLLDKVLVFLKK